MLSVQQIMEILPSLHVDANHFDVQLAEEIRMQLISYDTSAELTPELLHIICKVFAKRWHIIRDGGSPYYDYTMYPDKGNNVAWIALAKKLQYKLADLDELRLLKVGKRRSAVQILIPDFTNNQNSTNLENIPDTTGLGELFLSEEDNVLHSVKAMHEELRKAIKRRSSSCGSAGAISYSVSEVTAQPYEFCLYRSKEKHKKRPVSLHEIYRISAKRMHAGGSDFLTVLRIHVMPTWESSGELPLQFLPCLLKLVDAYYQRLRGEMPAETFYAQLRQFSKELYTNTSIEDSNHLFGQKIRVNDCEYFLIDMLVRLYTETALEQEIKAVAAWLCEKDATLMSAEAALQEQYQELGFGPVGFGIKKLKLSLQESLLPGLHQEMQLENPPRPQMFAELIHDTENIIRDCATKSRIDAPLVEALAALYKKRWYIIRGKDDYTWESALGKNSPWIQLARDLKAAGWIAKDYYCFLMPSLQEEVDRITREPLSAKPLSYYILAQDGASLILIENCVNHFREYRTFYNCNKYPTVPLTEDEWNRLSSAHKKFRKYRAMARTVPDDPCIRRSTLQAVYDLVNDSLFTSGLTAGSKYDVATRVLQSFNADEVNRLKCLVPEMMLSINKISLKDIDVENPLHLQLVLNADELNLLIKSNIPAILRNPEIAASDKERLCQIMSLLEQCLQGRFASRLGVLCNHIGFLKTFLPNFTMSNKVALREVDVHNEAYKSMTIKTDELVFIQSELMNLAVRKLVLLRIMAEIDTCLHMATVSHVEEIQLFERTASDSIELLRKLLPNHHILLADLDISSGNYQPLQCSARQARHLKQAIGVLVADIDRVGPDEISDLIEKLTQEHNEINSTYLAYEKFFKFIADLDPVEKQKLYDQNILLFSQWKTVKELLDDLRHTEDNQGCVASAGKFFAKLVMDYAPDMRFCARLEADHHHMKEDLIIFRRSSRRKILQEDLDLTLLRIEYMLYVIIKGDFRDVPEHDTDEIHLSAVIKRTVPKIVAQVFNSLTELLESTNRYKILSGSTKARKIAGDVGSCRKIVTLFNQLQNNVIEAARLKMLHASSENWVFFSIFGAAHGEKIPQSCVQKWLDLMARHNVEQWLTDNPNLFPSSIWSMMTVTTQQHDSSDLLRDRSYKLNVILDHLKNAKHDLLEKYEFLQPERPSTAEQVRLI